MEKLTIKHLAPYLPYGLKIQGQTHGQIEELSACDENNVNIKDRGFQYGWWADMFDVKPILRPLSDLTKEIENIGIPLRKLCRLFAYKEQYVKDWNFGERDGVYFASATDPIMTRLFEYNSKDMFFILSNPRDKEKLNCKQFEAFQKLFEWHFDVFGLIEKGLAINLNDLE